jgi:hypothetical protein
VSALEAKANPCVGALVLLSCCRDLGIACNFTLSGDFALPSQPTRAMIADNSHGLYGGVYAARYLNILGFRQLETRTQHLRARPFNEALPQSWSRQCISSQHKYRVGKSSEIE